MQKMADNIWILSNLDLKICMQALGYKGEMDFPVMQRESSLSERIASSVVKLNQMGFLYLEENGYQPTEQLKESFSGIINSDLKLRVLKKESMPIVFYKKDRIFTAVEQMSVQQESVRISYLSEHAFLDYICKVPGGQLVDEFEKKHGLTNLNRQKKSWHLKKKMTGSFYSSGMQRTAEKCHGIRQRQKHLTGKMFCGYWRKKAYDDCESYICRNESCL